MTPTTNSTPEGQNTHWTADPDVWTPEEQRELAQLRRLSDGEILGRAGALGPAVIGRPLAYLAGQIRVTNPDGALGPALLDPDYHAKQLAARESAQTARPKAPAPRPDPARPSDGGEGWEGGEVGDAGSSGANASIDPADLNHPQNPWTYVTLSGAKQLAMQHQLSHKPRITRRDLIAELQKAQVAPPPVPTDLEDDDDELEEPAG